RHADEDFHRHSIDDIAERERLGSTAEVRLRDDAVAEATQQLLHDGLFVALDLVIDGPVLRVGFPGDFDRVRDGLNARLLELDGPLVFAAEGWRGIPTEFVVRACTGRCEEVYKVAARRLRLRGYEPHRALDVLDAFVLGEDATFFALNV